MDFAWQDGLWSYKAEQDNNPPLCVRNHLGLFEPIQRIATTTAIRTVGVRIAPDGNNKEELTYLKEQIGIWTDRARSSRLPKSLVWLSLTTGILQKIAFPLSATTFTKKECYDLLTPLLATALPTIGINRTFPWAMIHAPLSRQGLALPNTYIKQGICHLQRLTENTARYGDITGHLLDVSIEQLLL